MCLWALILKRNALALTHMHACARARTHTHTHTVYAHNRHIQCIFPARGFIWTFTIMVHYWIKTSGPDLNALCIYKCMCIQTQWTCMHLHSWDSRTRPTVHRCLVIYWKHFKVGLIKDVIRLTFRYSISHSNNCAFDAHPWLCCSTN